MPTRKYNRYDTALISLYALGKEHLVPDQLRRSVPCSTVTAWRKLSMSTLIGHELRHLQADALELHELLGRYTRLRHTLFTVIRVWDKVSSSVLPLIRQQADGLERLVDGVQQLFTVMPRKRALDLAGISATGFYLQLSRIKVRCGLSPKDLCLGRHPLQLSVHEVKTIERLHADPALACWPGSSLYYEGLRNRGLGIALSTFYHYVDVLGLKRKWSKPPKKVVGLRSTRPNEFLHVDTTHWPLDDHVTGSIVLVSDNFSKAILGCSVAANKRAENVVRTAQIHLHDPHVPPGNGYYRVGSRRWWREPCAVCGRCDPLG